MGDRSVPNDLLPLLDTGLTDPLVIGELVPLRVAPAAVRPSQPEVIAVLVSRCRRKLLAPRIVAVDHLFPVPVETAATSMDKQDWTGECLGEHRENLWDRTI